MFKTFLNWDMCRMDKLKKFGQYVAQCLPKYIQQIQVIKFDILFRGEATEWTLGRFFRIMTNIETDTECLM